MTMAGPETERGRRRFNPGTTMMPPEGKRMATPRSPMNNARPERR
ncbi:hypothetical protein HMPREF1623_02229 [Escherichia coli 910096-2]|nr:hypothetical protein HMPREF1623_02229 [Escherichia coli 910096-2]